MFRSTIRALALSAAPLAVVATGVLLTPAAAHADPVGGVQIRESTVEAHATDAWKFALYGREVTRIQLCGDGDTTLELRVYDAAGNLVAADTLGPGDDRIVCITPRQTGTFTVKITNRGRVHNNYLLVLD